MDLLASPKPTAEPPAAEKQPWEMTKEEFKLFQPTAPEWLSEGLDIKSRARSVYSQRTLRTVNTLDYELPDKDQARWGFKTYRDVADAADKWIKQHPEYVPDHEEAVTDALSEGKPVPPEVLADYPELAEQAKLKLRTEKAAEMLRKKKERAAQPPAPPIEAPAVQAEKSQ